MKKVLFFLLLFIATQVFAGPVDYETAKEIAQKYIGKKSGAKKSVKYKSSAPKKAGSTSTATAPAYYIFDIEDNEGFVVVSGDDLLKPILAHTDNGSFNPNKINPAVQWWLSLVEENVAEARKSPQTFAVATASNDETAVEPLITTKWGQGYPYNLLCPVDPVHGGTCVTGCCATAMAQVINYHRYPNQVTGTFSYTTDNHSIEIYDNLDWITFDWDNMLNEYTSEYTTVQSNAVAQLMRACGFAIESDYCSYETTGYTTKITEALVNKFGYKGAQMLQRKYFTFNEWEAIIKSELNKQRPVIYRGQNATGGGHLFVCDGYNTDGLFHINWGWDGYEDGYFELTSMNYNSWQYAVCGVSPQNTQAPVNLPDIVYEYFNIPEQTTFERSNIYAVYTGIENASINYSEGYFGLAITKNDEIISYSFDEDFIYSLESGWSCSRMECYINIPNDVPDGEYKLIPVYKTIDSDEVKKMYCKYANGKADHLVVTLNGETATISVPDTYVPSAVEVTRIEYPKIISNSETIEITFTLKNNTATDFDDSFTCSLIANDGYTHEVSQYANIPTNEERQFTVTFTIPESGNKFWFGIRSNSYWWADNTYIYYDELTISGATFEADGIFYSIINETNKTVKVTYQGDNYSQFSNEYTGEITIPENVTYEGNSYTVKVIGQDAFRNCTGLTEITIPASITSIETDAFAACSKLKEVYNFSALDIVKGATTHGGIARYAANVISIPGATIEGDFIFDSYGTLLTYKGCDSEVTLPDNYKGESYNIGDNAFRSNTTITSITIPAGVTNIGECAFDGCSNLTSIYVQGETPALLFNNTFADISDEAILYVPAGTKAAYQSNVSQREAYDIALTTVHCNNLRSAMKNYNTNANYETVTIDKQNSDVTGSLLGNDYLLAYQPSKTEVTELPKVTFGLSGTRSGLYKIALVTPPWFIKSYKDTVVSSTTLPQYADSYLRVKVSQENELLALLPGDSVEVSRKWYVPETSAIVPNRAVIDTIFLKDSTGEDYIFDLKNSRYFEDNNKEFTVDVNIELLRPAQMNNSGRYTAKSGNKFAFRFMLDQIMFIPVEESVKVSTTYWNRFNNIVEEGAAINGDINNDGDVDIADITTIVALILSSTYTDTADINNDGSVDIADITKLVSIILQGK